MTTLIMKFGGSTVGMNIGLTQVLSIVLYEYERWDRLLLVVSALDGVTDALLEAAYHAQLSNRRGYRRIVGSLRQRHLSLTEQLPLGVNERNALQADIDQLLFNMLDACQAMSDSPNTVQPDSINAVIAVGERLAARIVAAVLRQNQLRSVAIDATDLIITDSVFSSATPNLALTRDRITQSLFPMLSRKIIPVITGFIGSTITGKTTVLGRGGSDLTASILGVCIDADEVWIWTDVDGMMTADPALISSAISIPALAYEEAAELAYFGARVLHSRMIQPLRERHIPLRIRNLYKPQQTGTIIRSAENDLADGLKAVTCIPGLALTAPQSGSLAIVSGVVDETLFAITGSHADVMIVSQSSAESFVCYVIPTTAGQDAPHTLQNALEEKLRTNDLPAWSVRAVNVMTIIGAHINQQPALMSEILNALGDIRILALAHGAAGHSFSVVTETEDSPLALARAHDVVLKNG